jgi:hypothetical protein
LSVDPMVAPFVKDSFRSTAIGDGDAPARTRWEVGSSVTLPRPEVTMGRPHYRGRERLAKLHDAVDRLQADLLTTMGSPESEEEIHTLIHKLLPRQVPENSNFEESA